MKNQIKLLAVIIFILTLTISCKDKVNYSKMDNSPTTSANDLHKIVVNETADGGTYLYVNVEENGNKYWMAIPNMDITVGNTYYYNGGMEMKDFESKHLDKTFDFIIFAEGIRETEEMMIASANEDAHNHELSSAETVMIDKIEKAAGGMALEEVFTQRQTLNKKSVIVKGKVVKVNNGIMDKNWVHIQDGTQFKGEKDLTITTKEEVKLGDIVTFKGTVILDKDFGAGYVYEIVLEEAVLVK